MALKIKEQKIIEDICQKLLGLLKVEAKIFLESQEERTQVLWESPEAGILIGWRGQTLSALEQILSLLVYKKLGFWQRITLDISGYRQKKEEALKALAQRMAEKVKISGQPVDLPFLSSQERRIIHLALSDDPKVVSESEGEGENRRLIIKLRA